MNTVAQLLAHKQHWNDGDHATHRIERVHTIPQASTALDAAKLMNEHHIGSLIVTDTFNNIAGIITERDILTRIVTAQLDPASTPISKVMTKEVIHCTPDSSLDEVRHLMTDCKIRHIPVIDHNNPKHPLAGIVSIGDLNAAFATDLNIEVKSLRQYIIAG
tara:strand:+ start:6167 stop:6649 length:483 start_codon:yes stop_codon:yes gene_type:complete